MVNFSRPGMPSPNFFLWLALRWSNTVGLLFTIDFSANEVSVSFRVLAGKSLAAGGWKLSFSEIWRTLKGLGEEIGDLSSVMGDCMHGLADLAEDGGGEPMPRTSSALPLPLVVRTLVTEGLLGGAGLPKLASHPESFLKRPLCWSDSLRLGRNLANLSFKKNIYISLSLKFTCNLPGKSRFFIAWFFLSRHSFYCWGCGCLWIFIVFRSCDGCGLFRFIVRLPSFAS